MGSRSRVATILRNALTLSLTAPLFASCGIDTDGFEPITCRSEGGPALLRGVAPQNPAGYIELRQLGDGLGGGEPRTLESIGTKCEGAADVAVCSVAIAEAGMSGGFGLGNCVDFCPSNILIVNTGDTVDIVDTKEKLQEWLGPIDSEADAVFLVAASGYQVPCDTPSESGVRSAGNGYEVLATKYTAVCDPIERTLFVLGVDAAGKITEVETEVLESESGACIGRRPTGLKHAHGRGTTRLGAYFASITHLEAASVHAFDTLERELIHHDAPRHLVLAAQAARRDEIRHARVMGRLAKRYGGSPPEPRVEAHSVRSLEDMTLENATEGCIRETYGALVGMWQAKFAQDAELRRVMERIARDETRHASLSWAIHHWAYSKLSPEARQRITQARQWTMDQVVAEAYQGHDPQLVETAGLPDASAGQRLVQQFVSAVETLSEASKHISPKPRRAVKMTPGRLVIS